MRATCCICCDLFDEVNPMSSTNCGHVYHTNCLMVWIKNSKTCPKCRVPLKSDQIVKLYFDFRKNDAENAESLENSLSDLKAQLLAKDAALLECRKQRDEIKIFAKEAEKRTAEMQQFVYQLESDVANLRLKNKEIPKLKSKVETLESSSTKLFKQIELLENVQTVVQGTSKDVESILQANGNSQDSAKQMATYCSVLKKELEKILFSKNELLDMNSKLKLDNSRLSAKIRLYENRLKASNVSETPKNPLCFKQNNDSSKESCHNTSDEQSASVCSEGSSSSAAFSHLKYSLQVGSSSSKCVKSSKRPRIQFSGIKNDENSITRHGFDGLGGHNKFINSSKKRL